MTVKELIKFVNGSSPIIAINAYNGKVLFDSRKNNKKYVEKYYNGIVLHIWADIGSTSYDKTCYSGVIKCYVRNKSWLNNEVNNND